MTTLSINVAVSRIHSGNIMCWLGPTRCAKPRASHQLPLSGGNHRILTTLICLTRRLNYDLATDGLRSNKTRLYSRSRATQSHVFFFISKRYLMLGQERATYKGTYTQGEKCCLSRACMRCALQHYWRRYQKQRRKVGLLVLISAYIIWHVFALTRLKLRENVVNIFNHV